MGITTVLGAIMIAVTVFLFVSAVKSHVKKTKMYLFIASFVLLIATLIIPMSFVVISTGEIGVVKVFGEAKNTINAGINFVPWITSEVNVYDVKTRELNLDFQAYSKDAQTVTGQLAIQYQIQPEMVMDINRQYGSTTILEEKLKAVIIERAKSVFSDKGAMLIVESRSALSGEIEERIKPTMGQYHVSITMVALADISFNDAFENAVEQKMVAEQEKLRAEYDKERAIIKAEENLEVAQREAQSAVAKANGDAEALRIMQSAWSSLSAEVKEAMLRQTFYEKWNGILPNVMAGDSVDLILNGMYNED